MTKWVFFILLAMNVLLAGLIYHQYRHSSEAPVTVDRSPRVGDLKLLSELSPVELRELAGRSRAPAVSEPDTAKEATLEQPPQDAGGLGGAGPLQPAAAMDEIPPDEEVRQTTVAVVGGDGTGDGSVPLESPAAMEPPPVDAAAFNQPSGEGEAPVSHCFTLGSFNKLADVERVLAPLQPSVARPELRQEREQKTIGYWVLIPPSGSLDEAREMVNTLKQAGITDVWRFTKGRLAHAISLGLYSRRGPAERHSQRISEKGFNAEVQPRYVEEPRYWLDFRAPENFDLPAAVEAILLVEYPGMELRPRACPEPEQHASRPLDSQSENLGQQDASGAGQSLEQAQSQ